MDIFKNNRALKNCVTCRGHMNHHHVTIIVSCKTGNILSYAPNIQLERSYRRSVHAEVTAINKLFKTISRGKLDSHELRKGVSLISLRIAPGGHFLMAKPCCECDKYIKRFPLIRSVGWSIDDGTLIFE